MALDIAATQSGNVVNLAVTDGTGTLSIYYSYNSADVASSSAALAAIQAGTLKFLKTSALASFSYAHEVVGNETYYYCVINSDGTKFDSANITTTVTIPNICLTDTAALLESTQNAAAGKDFSAGVDVRYAKLVLWTSATSALDSAVEALAGEGQSMKVLANADITTISGKQPAVVGKATVKYL